MIDILDNVVTSVLVFEGDAKLQQYVGGYTDWADRGKALLIKDVQEINAANAKIEEKKTVAVVKPKKLSYKIQREYDMLPNKISDLETDIERLNKEIASPSFYSKDFNQTAPVLAELSAAEASLENKMTRWLEIEEMQA